MFDNIVQNLAACLIYRPFCNCSLFNTPCIDTANNVVFTLKKVAAQQPIPSKGIIRWITHIVAFFFLILCDLDHGKILKQLLIYLELFFAMTSMLLCWS